MDEPAGRETEERGRDAHHVALPPAGQIQPHSQNYEERLQRLLPREGGVHDERRVEREEERDQKGQALPSWREHSREETAGKVHEDTQQREDDLIEGELLSHVTQKVCAEDVHERGTGCDQVPVDEERVFR